MILRVPLFNLSEAGRGFLAAAFLPRLRSLCSLSLGLLRIKPRRGFAFAEKITRCSRMGINPTPTVDACNTLIIRGLQSESPLHGRYAGLRTDRCLEEPMNTTIRSYD